MATSFRSSAPMASLAVLVCTMPAAGTASAQACFVFSGSSSGVVQQIDLSQCIPQACPTPTETMTRPLLPPTPGIDPTIAFSFSREEDSYSLTPRSTSCNTFGTWASAVNVYGLGDKCALIEWGFNARGLHTKNIFSQEECGSTVMVNIDDGSGGSGRVTVTLINPLPTADTVSYAMLGFSSAARRHEDPGLMEDQTLVPDAEATLSFGGGAVIVSTAGALDINPPDFSPGARFRSKRFITDGSFVLPAFSSITLDLDVNIDLDVDMPHEGSSDTSSASFRGVLLLVSGGGASIPPTFTTEPPPGFDAAAGVIAFGVDLGSDAEISDPFGGAPGTLDPGDIYSAFGPFFGSPFDGDVLDDANLPFGPIDPSPFGLLAPVCDPAAHGDLSDAFFDIDDVDILDLDLRGLLPSLPLPTGEVFPTPPSATLFPPTNLLISFDDDGAAGYAVPCNVPTTTGSPTQFVDYGTTGSADEVLEYILAPRLAGPPATSFVAQQLGLFSESELHAALSPDPDGSLAGAGFDDDVDSLDILWQPQFGIATYFTVDHEADAGLDPGTIYIQSPPGGPIDVAIDHVPVLGLAPGTDIDAFEFVSAPNPFAGKPANEPVLAIIFSVNNNDPATPADETGGLSPNRLYISFLNGVSVPLTAALPDDIDAVAAWWQPPSLTFIGQPEPPCLPDVNNDGILSPADFSAWIAAFNAMSPGCDQNGDGLCTPADFSAWVANFNAGC